MIRLRIADLGFLQRQIRIVANSATGYRRCSVAEFARIRGILIGEIGFRSLNISKDNPAFFSLGPVDADRFEAFKSAFTLLGRLDYLRQVRGNLAARIRGGLSWVIITVGEDAQSDLFYDYGLQIGYEKRLIHFSGGISGRIPLVEDESATTIESYHQFVLSIGAAFSILRPGIQLRIPVSDAFRKMVDSMLSVSLGVQIR